jgi:glycosyltransferase involved in cell wall biosynthesis
MGPIRSASSRYAGGKNPVRSADIFHATYYRPESVDKRDSRKLVVTIHDYIPEYLGWTGIRNPHIGKSQLIKKADLIVCVSEVTKQAMFDNIGYSPKNVRVIPHGTEFVDRYHQNIGTFTVLYVGHRRGYKNYQLLIRALRGLEKYRDYKLILAGPKLDLEERTYLDSLIRDRWISIENPSDKDLQKLYSKVSIHCVTSLMEGFGMTAIEAIGAACPVIATRIPIFQESLAEHGVLVDAQDSSELREEIKKFMLNENYYGEIQNSLFDIRLRYSWESRTTELANAYQEILG